MVVRRQPGLRKRQGILSPSVCLRGWPVQGQPLAQVGMLLDGSGSGLLRVLVQRTAHASGTRTKKCASVAALPCSHQSHRTVDQTLIRPRTSTEIRLSPCLRRPTVCPAPTPLLSLFFALRSLFDVSALIKVVSACRWIFSLVVSRPFWPRSRECLFILDGSFCGAFSAFVLARWHAWNPPR